MLVHRPSSPSSSPSRRTSSGLNVAANPAHRKQLAQITGLHKQMMEQEQSGDPASRLRSMSLLPELMYELYTDFSHPVSEAVFEQSRLVVTDIPLRHLLERHGFTNYKKFRQSFYEKFQTTPSVVRGNQKGKMESVAAQAV